MDDPRTADGVEHLQRAARELLAAARSFLDVAEEMVEDPDRFTGAASQVADLLRGGLGAVMPDGDSSSRLQPWETAAWSADAEPDGPPEESADRATVDQLFGDTDRLFSDTDELFSDTDEPEGDPAPARRRVRRIAVD